MGITYADFSSYKRMVKALANNGEIDYGDATYVNSMGVSFPIRRSDINVGPASPQLQAMGFSQYFVYDRSHFEQAMMEEQTSDKSKQDPDYHGHDLSEEELLLLPKLLNSPEIIITAPIRTDFTGTETQALEFLCKNKSEDKEKSDQYYKIIVAPQNMDCGHITNKGEVNKVISFFRVSEETLRKDFRDIEKSAREVLYFDSSKSKENPAHLPFKLRDSEDIAKKITGKYIPFKEKGRARRVDLFGKAITACLESRFDRTKTTASQFSTFDNLYSDIKNIKMTDYMKDKIEKGDIKVADLYFRKLKGLHDCIDIVIKHCESPERNKIYKAVAEVVAEKYKEGVEELTEALKTHLENTNQKLDKIIDSEMKCNEKDLDFVNDMIIHLDFVEESLPDIDNSDFTINSHNFPEIAETLRNTSDNMGKQIKEILSETMNQCFDAQEIIENDIDRGHNTD